MEEKKKIKGNGGKHLDKKKYFEFLIYKEPWGSKALARYVSVSTSEKKAEKEQFYHEGKYLVHRGKNLPMLLEKQKTRNNGAN